MLKRKLARAGLFGNGLILVIATMYGTHEQPAKTAKPEVIDPIILQLQAFDSSFIELREFPAESLSDVPRIQMNFRAVKFVKEYNRRNDEALAKIKLRGYRYFPIMDSIFRSYRLPTELKYLAAVESELKPTAVSRVGAVGPWQLMASTAKDLSLKVNGRYDERTNYTKSTVAAAKYLRDLYRQFGDWLLVIASYNSGPGKVMSAIKLSGSHNFWVLQSYLPPETRGHVKRFIATHYYFEDYGSVTTLTKSETKAYKAAVSQFITNQRNAQPQPEIIADVKMIADNSRKLN